MAKLIGIATHTESEGAITTHETIKISEETGLKNDYRGSLKTETAVTLISQKSWEKACQECGAKLDWTERRANLLINDIEFNDDMIGQQVQIGNVLLEITRETNPCLRMEDLHKGLFKALAPQWRGGARCKVLRKGEIQLGDKVTVLKRF